MILVGKGSFAKKHKLDPTQIIALGFAGVILTGAFLLTLPISAKSGGWTSFINALFTATSATCVTGLVAVDTYQYYTDFGQAIIALLIQIGGLGVMTFATLLSMLFRRNISMKERLLQTQSISAYDMRGIVRVTKHILIGTLIFEGIGATLLSIRFAQDFGVVEGIKKGIFHAISAFCNAGFDILGDKAPFVNLTGYVNDITVNVVIMSLIVIGGLGFVVWEEILYYRKTKKFSLYTKMVLGITAALIFGGALLIFLFENSNPETLGPLSPLGKTLASFFQSITPRTAGFNTISQSGMTSQSKVLTTFLMFVGGSSGSTAGGIKTFTFGLIVAAVLSAIRGRKEVTIGKKRISNENVYRAFTLAFVGLTMVTVASFVMSSFDGTFSVFSAFYEAMSAFGTVGLSLGITPTLSVLSKLILITLMYFGRVGIITIAYALIIKTQNNNLANIRYPEETRINIG